MNTNQQKLIAMLHCDMSNNLKLLRSIPDDQEQLGSFDSQIRECAYDAINELINQLETFKRVVDHLYRCDSMDGFPIRALSECLKLDD